MKKLMLLFCLSAILLGFLAVNAEECDHDFDLRLVQTPSLSANNSGRLEVCRTGERWGSIFTATTFWSQKNVLVACQYLGYPSGLNSVPAVQLSFQDQPSGSLLMHIEAVVCDGTELSLGECDYMNSTRSSFSGGVYIVCLPGPDVYSGLHTLRRGFLQREGDVRLKGHPNDGRGVVEIFTRLGWSTICPDSSWTSSDADVVCQALGYEFGVTENFLEDPGRVQPRILHQANCGGSTEESSVIRISAGECSFEHSEVDNLCPVDRNLFAGVSCRTTSREQSMRLFPQTVVGDNSEGIVEVLIDSRWGAVCVPSDLTQVSTTLCHELGFDRSNAALIDSNTNNLLLKENRVKPIWYPDLTCITDGRRVSSCTPTSPVGYGDCMDILALQCRNPLQFEFSTGPIAGVLFFVLGLLIVAIWFCTHGKQVWVRRHGSAWHRRVTSCQTTCCVSSSRGTTASNRATATPAQPVVFDLQRRREPDPEPEDRDLTSLAPPTYHAAADLPSPIEELPPPYPGPSSSRTCPSTQDKPGYPPSGYPPSGDPAYPPPPQL